MLKAFLSQVFNALSMRRSQTMNYERIFETKWNLRPVGMRASFVKEADFRRKNNVVIPIKLSHNHEDKIHFRSNRETVHESFEYILFISNMNKNNLVSVLAEINAFDCPP